MQWTGFDLGLLTCLANSVPKVLFCVDWYDEWCRIAFTKFGIQF